MAQVKQGDKVKFDYTGMLKDGTVFDSTLEGEECNSEECETGDCDHDDCGCGCETGPFELTIGSGEFFTQVEEALVGMAPGDKRTVVVPAVDAFGEHDTEKVFTVPRSDVPADLNPAVGDELILSNDENDDFGVTVTEVTVDSITFDANHPLAGEDLTFEIQLVEIL